MTGLNQEETDDLLKENCEEIDIFEAFFAIIKIGANDNTFLSLAGEEDKSLFDFMICYLIN